MILIDQNIPRLKEALSAIRGYEVGTFSGRDINNQSLRSSGAEYLFVRSTTKVDKMLLQDTNIKFVATATAGTDHFDWEFLDSTKIQCVSADGANSNSVAEYPVYAAARFINERGLRPNRLKAGIIGYGHIGKKVASYFAAMGMEVLVNDSLLKREKYQFPDYLSYGKIIDIFSSCDIITNHIPLSSDSDHPTLGWFDQHWLSMIKPGSLFIHASRGKILVEEDALQVTNKNELELCIDVWADEPDFHVELAKKCMLATPHISAYSAQGKVGGAMMVAKAFEAFSGLKPDYKAFELEAEPEKYTIREIGDAQGIEKVLRERRKFDLDTQDLLELANLDATSRKTGFDKLRKNYPVRHETFKLK